MSNPLRTHVKNFLLYKFWEIGPSFINKYTVSVSIYERLAGVTSKLAQNEYTGPATNVNVEGHSTRARFMRLQNLARIQLCRLCCIRLEYRMHVY